MNAVITNEDINEDTSKKTVEKSKKRSIIKNCRKEQNYATGGKT